MLATVWEAIENALGLPLPPGDLGFGHMALRSIVVFATAVALARIADRRFLGQSAGYDIMLGVILGSVLSRGINGQAAFFPTLGASAVMVALHHALSTGSYHWRWLSALVKGPPRTLVRDGRIDAEELRFNKITRDELSENLRLHGNVAEPAQVAEARLETNGRISVVKRE